MGGYDVFCALCGARAGQPYWDEDDEYDEFYDSQVIRREDTEWMEGIRIIGENPSSVSVEKVFVSGPALADDCGRLEVTPGDDPQFLGPDYTDEPSGKGTVTLTAYSWDEDYPVVIPFHAACYELLEKMVALPNKKTSRIDKGILYQTLRSLCEVEDETGFDCMLNRIDYGAVTELQQQFWFPKRGTEAFVSLPTIIPALSHYYKSLPKQKSSNTFTNETATAPTGKKSDFSDVFSKIPTEILFWIMSYLDMASVNAFRASTRCVSQLKLENSFWKQRLFTDMPWLYDFPSVSTVTSENRGLDKVDGSSASIKYMPEDAGSVNIQEYINWAQIYKDMLHKSKPNSTQKILGLVNRRRIWTLCQQIAIPYLERKLKTKKNHTELSLLEEADSTPMLRLISPGPTEFHLSSVALVSKRADLLSANPKIMVWWNSRKEFSGLTVHGNDPATTNFTDEYDQIGSSNHLISHDDIILESSNWLTGIILTSREMPGEKDAKNVSETYRRVIGLEFLFTRRDPIRLGNSSGDKRLMHVSFNSVLIGFSAQWTSDGLVSKLALLQTELKSDLKASIRFQSPRDLEFSTSGIKGRLWRDELPPLDLKISNFISGYWSNMKHDLALREPLILGYTDEELSAVTAIAADVQFGGFEVRYSDRKPRSIGTNLSGIKIMSIDGKGGERVVGLYVSNNHIPEAVRIVTNRDRQLIIGQPYSGFEQALFAADGDVLVGMYAIWIMREKPQSRLDAIGILSKPVYGSENMEISSLCKDENQFYWDPEPPPDNWNETGKIYGEYEMPNNYTSYAIEVLSERTTVAWLDCSKPVSIAVASFVHATRSSDIPLMGIVLKYSDGSQSQIGPSEFSSCVTDTDMEGELAWCWCHFGNVPKEELQKPHYTSDEWKVGDQLLKFLRLWGEEPLVGLQFVANNDTESPKWGKCEGQPTGIIEFNGRTIGQPVVGLKAFIAGNGRQTTRDDPIIKCFQALSIKEGNGDDV